MSSSSNKADWKDVMQARMGPRTYAGVYRVVEATPCFFTQALLHEHYFLWLLYWILFLCGLR